MKNSSLYIAALRGIDTEELTGGRYTIIDSARDLVDECLSERLQGSPLGMGLRSGAHELACWRTDMSDLAGSIAHHALTLCGYTADDLVTLAQWVESVEAESAAEVSP